ncbi:serine hydrolase [Paenibacillus sp. 2TAB26]|uniref:serine hydrolase n=1 Tax=Paenibacillus sp. 2TAB26 TaxID=3233005 RepID=UPI003F95A672
MMLMFQQRRKSRKAWAPALLAATIAFSAISFPAKSVEAAGATGPKDAKEVEAFVDEFFKRPEVASSLAGSAVVVVGNDKVLLNKGYGYADVESKKPVDPDKTMFRIASISKVFTATAVMQLVEEGKIDLDQDVSPYLKGVTIPNKTGSKLTMRHLLTHTTGFDKTDVLTAPDATRKDYPLEQYIKENLPTIVRKPGAAYRYDNLAFNYQGLIVQNVTGKPFEQVIDEQIFHPLQMTNSDFRMTDKVLENLATGYNQLKEPWPQYQLTPTIAPDGGMFATGTDMSKFMLAQLNGGKLGENRILQENTVKEMQRVQVGIHSEIPNMALGFEMFFQEHFNGETVIGKGGDLEGYHSWMWLLPEQKVGGFVVTNSDASDIREQLFAAFMDHYYPKTEKERPAIALTKAQLARFEGSYQYLRAPLVYYKVKAEDGYLSVAGPNSTRKLKPVGELLFQDEDGKLGAFKRDEAGNISYFYYLLIDAWCERITPSPNYSDVPRNHPYADDIYTLRDLGGVLNQTSTLFEPEGNTTRAQFAAQIVRLAGITKSHQSSKFTDLKAHPYESEIQTLLEIHVLSGTSAQRFEPDRTITREEAAVIIYRLSRFLGFPPIPAKLSGKTSAWAEEAVQFIVGARLYGPEIKTTDKGTDFRSRDPLLNKEAAVILNRFAKLFASSAGI